MTLILDLILMYMEELEPVCGSGVRKDMPVCGMEYYCPGRELSPGTIQLISPEDAESVEEKAEDTVFFSVNIYTHSDENGLKNFVFFKKADNLNVIYETYAKILNTLSSWQGRMNKSLASDGSPEGLLAIAKEQIRLPVICFDSLFTITACSTDSDLGIGDWERVVNLGYAPPEYMAAEQMRNMERKVLDSEKGICGRGIDDPSTCNLFRAHKSDGNFAALTMVFCGKEKPRPGLLALCEMFFEIIDLYVKLNESSREPLNFLYENLLAALMQTKDYPESRLTDQLKYVNLPEEGIFTLIRMDFGGEDNYRIYICTLLQRYFPDLCFFMYQNEVCLLYRTGRTEGIYNHRGTISGILEKITARLGAAYPAEFRVSGPFEKISGLHFANKQCGLLINADNPQRSGSVIFFEDNIPAAAFALLKEQLPPEYMTPSVLTEIEKYDAAHKSSLAQTLRIYLSFGGNLSETAQELGMHRNSIDKRIKKIRTLFNLDPDDMQTAAGLYMVMNLCEAGENGGYPE